MKGSGNFKFPEFKPQTELTSVEENSKAPDEQRMHSSFAKQSAEMFQGIYADGTHLFIPLYKLVEIRISTKGVDKVNTLRRNQDFDELKQRKKARFLRAGFALQILEMRAFPWRK